MLAYQVKEGLASPGHPRIQKALRMVAGRQGLQVAVTL